MSLSKVYKESQNFHPEEILRRPDTKGPSRTDPAPSRHAFKETPSGNPSAQQGFRQNSMLVPVPSPPSPQAVTTPYGSSSLSREEGGPGDAPLEENSQTTEIAPGIDPLVVEEMVEEAFGRGIAEGQRRAEADYGSATVALLELCRQLDQFRETLLKNSFGEMQDLTLALAEKIIRASVLEQDATILATVEEALHSAVRSDEFYIYVNPEDFDTIQAKSADLVSGLSGLNNIVIKKDSTLERGGCKVESENCTVDATIASQFELIRDKIKERLTFP